MTSQDQQVTVRPTSSQDVREYHFEEQISKLAYAEFWLPMHDSSADLKVLGTKGEKLAGTVLADRNKGSIERVTFRPYSMRVYREPSASWAEVEEKIVIPAIRSAINSQIKVVQYGKTLQRERERQLATA